MRVKVPFGNKLLIGVSVGVSQNSNIDRAKLKFIDSVLDNSPILPEELWQLIERTARYYHHPWGETLSTALPNALMKGEKAELKPINYWQITHAGLEAIPNLPSRSVRIQQALRALESSKPTSEESLKANEIQLATLRKLQDKGWATCSELEQGSVRQSSCDQNCLELNASSSSNTGAQPISRHSLTPEQKSVVEQVLAKTQEFHPVLIDGITGSGKTEVYLNIIEHVTQTGQQALVLVPEIGLTPQTIRRFESRFPNKVASIHSGLTDKQRLNHWLKARAGIVDIIIGTRSAVFTPFKNLGIVIVDEEHDLSFKQSDGLRYSSRDLSLFRGQIEQVPVILGSATPSLETLYNAKHKNFSHLLLKQRATGATLPEITIENCKDQPLQEGFTKPLLNKMYQHLKKNQQVLVFINRRGFAPVLLCHRCSWMADCKRCDAHLTLHQSKQNDYLQCHHCGGYQSLPTQCPQCHAADLLAVGQGTERVEQFLSSYFSQYPIQRIDRDTTRRKSAMSDFVDAAKKGDTKILVGTQMLAKGHHFPKMSLVVILDIDGALFSSDFRAQERAAQLITQVSGRAGRSETEGEVVIQTHYADHSLLADLKNKSYSELAQRLLQERKDTLLPPYSHIALFRAESLKKQDAQDFLREVSSLFTNSNDALEVLGPVACTISRKAGRFRFQLMLNSSNRAQLHQLIAQHLPTIESSKRASKIRWSLDIDAQDLL